MIVNRYSCATASPDFSLIFPYGISKKSKVRYWYVRRNLRPLRITFPYQSRLIIDRGAKPSDLLVSQLWQILGGHKKIAASYTLVPADYLHTAPVFIDLCMLLCNLDLFQVRHTNLKNFSCNSLWNIYSYYNNYRLDCF